MVKTKIISVSLPDIMCEHIRKKGISRSAYIKALIAREMTNPMTPQELMTGIGISSMLQSGTIADNLKLPETKTEKKETEKKENPIPSKQIITPPPLSFSSEPKSVPAPETRKISEGKQEYLNDRTPRSRSRLDEGLPY